MRILVFCQYYYPEPFRISDICEELVKRGHEVTVVTGIPNYPMGEIYEGYGEFKKKNEVINGVNVHRCFTIPRKTGTLFRFLNYYSYAISASLYALKMKDNYDVVFVNQLSPVMMAYPGIVYSKKNNKKLVMYCLDLWPESLVAGGIFRDSIIYRVFHIISKRIYKNANKILVTSKSFNDYFKKEFGIENTEYLPQYAETIFTLDSCRKDPDDYLDLMFAGNVGSMQSVGTIIEAAKILKDDMHIRWHIVGDGSEIENVKTQAKDLNNVIFYGRKPLEEMPKYYSMADVMLVTMKNDPIINMTLPGKVQSYMAAGKPIIGVANGETLEIINDAGCGFCCSAEDYKLLANMVKHLKIENSHRDSSYEYYQLHFTKNNFIINLEESLN